MYRRLLLPVDDPSEVEPMIRVAATLLEATGEIRVLHVIPTITIPEVTRGWRNSVNIVLPAHEAGAALDVKVDPEVRASTDVVGEILESAESHNVDGIIMTLRGDRRSRNPFVGHAASAILQHARPDVLVVNRLLLTSDRVPRIILPTFSGAVAPKVMQLAEAISIRKNGAPIVVHSFRGASGPAPSTVESEERSPRGVAVQFRSVTIPRSTLGRRRHLAELILRAAAKERYGLLLVGEAEDRREGPMLTRRFLEDLFRQAPCPVMALRT